MAVCALDPKKIRKIHLFGLTVSRVPFAAPRRGEIQIFPCVEQDFGKVGRVYQIDRCVKIKVAKKAGVVWG